MHRAPNWFCGFDEVRLVDASAYLTEGTSRFNHRHVLCEIAGSVGKLKHAGDRDEHWCPPWIDTRAVADKSEQSARLRKTILVLVAQLSDFQKPCHLEGVECVLNVPLGVVDVRNEVARGKWSFRVGDDDAQDVRACSDSEQCSQPERDECGDGECPE